jgi:hypothetical protein
MNNQLVLDNTQRIPTLRVITSALTIYYIVLMAIWTRRRMWAEKEVKGRKGETSPKTGSAHVPRRVCAVAQTGLGCFTGKITNSEQAIGNKI